MGLLWAGLTGALVAFLLVFKPGRLLVPRHILAIVLAAAVAGFLSSLAFHLAYPYRSAAWAEAYRSYVFGGILAAALAPIIGVVAGFLWRRRSAAATGNGRPESGEIRAP